MNAYRSGNKAFAIMAVMFVTLAAGFVLLSDDSNASNYPIQNRISDSGFKEDTAGTLHVPVIMDTATSVTVTVTEAGSELIAKTFDNVEGEQTLDVSFKLSEGTHAVLITVDAGGIAHSASYTIDVGSNIWSNIITYVAIVVIAIIIIVIAVVYMRAKPNNKPTTTFTELEAEKKAAAKSEPAKAAPAKTEKVKYTSSRRK